MSAITFEYFRDKFNDFHLDIVKIDKVFFTKYILMIIDDGDLLKDIYLEKTTQDLKKLYESVRRYFGNFPIIHKHDENLIKIVAFAKEEWKHQNYLILEFLYAFLFKTRSYNKLKRPPGIFRRELNLNQSGGDFKDSQVSDQVKREENRSRIDSWNASIQESQIQELSPEWKIEEVKSGINIANISTIPSIIKSVDLDPNIQAAGTIMNSTRGRNGSTTVSDNSSKVKQIFKNIFICENDTYSTNYPRLILNEKSLLALSINRSKSEVFPVKFKVAADKEYISRYVNFSDKLMYFYEKERDYLADKDTYLEAMVLIKIDRIRYSEFSLDENKIYLTSEANMTDYEIIIAKKDTMTFLFSMCIELIRKDSNILKMDCLPDPLNNLGDVVLKFEFINDPLKSLIDSDEKVVNISLTYLNIRVTNLERPKTFYFTVLNVFDVMVFKTGKTTKLIEMLKVFDCEFNKFIKFDSFTFYSLNICRLSNYFQAYLSPILDNYHETLPLAIGFKKSYKELQRATFRLKRYFAMRDKLMDIISDFLCFKYPFFTNVVLIFATFMTVLFGVVYVLLTFFFGLLFFYHPAINQRLAPIVDEIFFNSNRLNKHYIMTRFKTEKALRKEFYMDIYNITRTMDQNQKLADKLKLAVDFSSRVPYHMHTFVDFFDKVKNLFFWKNHRKTELFVFFALFGSLFLLLVGKEIAFLLYIAMRYHYGLNYFKRIKDWNQKVLTFLLKYFVIDILEQGDLTCCHEFFNKYASDEVVISNFAKKFSEFLEKHLDIKTPEHLWKENFKHTLIMEILTYSNRRIILPFYEEKRKPSTAYLMGYFLFTTPSDFYYYNLEQLKTPIQPLK